MIIPIRTNILNIITEGRILYSVSFVKCNGTENVIKLIPHFLVLSTILSYSAFVKSKSLILI